MTNRTKGAFDFKAYLEEKRKEINQALERSLPSANADHDRIVKAMRYSLMADGKRLRPILCLAGADVVGRADQDVMTVACAIEMIHTYSLIHDDLPAMDDDDLRRGNATCHVQFDEATAILAGDALLTLSFELIAAVALNSAKPPARFLRIIHLLAAKSGYCGMIHGQMLDMESEGNSVGLESLKNMHLKKTGALIRASVLSGAMLAGATEAQLFRLDQYAENIGLAFQVTDDILNVEGDAEFMGKATGTDESRLKSTYPGILGLEPSREFAARLVSNALQALEFFDNKSNPLSALANYIIHRKR